MTRQKRGALSKTGLIRVNLGWTLWLLIVQPREGMYRFARYPLLWMAAGTVLLAGMVQGSLTAVNYGSVLQLAPVFGLRINTGPNTIVLSGMIMAVLLWLGVSLLVWVFAWLLEQPAPWQPALTTTGMAFLPWAVQGILLPLAAAGRPDVFLVVTLFTTPVAVVWGAYLLLVALETVMETSRRMGCAAFILVAYTCLFLIQLIVLILSVSLGGNLLRRLLYAG